MAASRITRHFATITDGRWGARQVHYRRAGRGPVVLCLHQSPLSSRDMLPTIQRWHRHFTCIAPDTPGFGLSDPLGVAQADMADFADAVVEFMDALGIERTAVYGFHTGAMIAGALAAKHPDRISCAVANGFVLLTEPERADFIEHYLPPLQPSWDGAHLAWLWARLREQAIFFPWYRPAPAHRLGGSVPSPERLQDALLDLMRSGDHHRVGYRAAFQLRSEETLRHAAAPLLVTASETDVLSKQLPRIRRRSEAVTVQAGRDPESTLDLARGFIARHADTPAPGITAPAALPLDLRQDFVDLPGGQLRLRRDERGGGRAVLLLHDAIGSSDTLRAAAQGFIGRRTVIALDLPGHGESDAVLPRGPVTVTGQARSVLAAIAALGVRQVDCLGVGHGALVALEAALREPRRFGRLALASLPYLDAAQRKAFRSHGAPDIRPDWHGGHLLHAWHMSRDQRLFWPWFDRSRTGVLRPTPQVEPREIDARVLELFRSEGMWRRSTLAGLAWPIEARLARLRVPTAVTFCTADPWLACARRAAEDRPELVRLDLPDEQSRWAEALLPWFDGP
jgi:pimeloyl-ACP methyl ester carboxylesterase